MHINHRKGFTLLEVLLVVAAISILAGIVIVALNPTKQFAEMNNAHRQTDIKTILDAVYQYSIDHHGSMPPGIDTTLRVIGTADTGCDIGCGEHITYTSENSLATALSPIRTKLASFLSVYADTIDGPTFLSAHVDPTKVVPGDIMRVEAEIEDPLGVKSVTANMGDIETIDLSLIDGFDEHGTWTTDWLVHDTLPIEYTTTITATNTQGKSTNESVVWFDPPVTGWVSPDGHQDPNNQWGGETNGYDGNTSTYTQNTYGGSGWGQFIVLTLSEAITSDRIRVNADYLNSHIREVDIDVYVDGAWVDVFQGGDESTWNCQWVELPFTKGEVTQARFRYNYRVGGYYYWLYEFEFYQTVETINPPTCNSQAATAIQENAAILHGLVVDDGGEPCEYRFQYGPTTSYGENTVWTGSVQSGGTFNEVISDLETDRTYHFQAQIRNSAGTADCGDLQFTTQAVGAGWVHPTGFTDEDNAWENETLAYDDTVVTYARSYHNINDPQWSSFLYFEHLPMYANGIRYYGRGGSEVSAVDVDVYRNDTWVDVYQGSFTDKSWVEHTFAEGTVSRARIRFYASSATFGFYWELYELGFYKTSEANASACLDLVPSLVPEYIPEMLLDPKDGTSERSYYAIKKDPNGRIIIHACNAELDETISIRR